MDIDRLERLLESKTWNELTAEEKTFVIEELGSEEQYNAIRKVSLALVSMHKADLSPDPSLEKKLRKKLAEKHAVAPLWQSVFQLRVPALASALLVIVTALTSWYFGKQFATQPERSPQIVHVTDTVYLQTKPDTIVVERVRYRSMQRTNDQEKVFTVVNQVKHTETESVKSINMKEKEELENFLVSGSD
jgi:hypothetical protein